MQSEIEELGGKLISISPEKPDKHKTEESKDAKSLITSDIENNLSKKLGLVFTISEELNNLYLQFGINLEDSNGNKSRELPIPATIITDKNLIVQYVYANINYTERSEPDEFIKILKNI